MALRNLRFQFVSCITLITLLGLTNAQAKPVFIHHTPPDGHKKNEDGTETWVSYSFWQKSNVSNPTDLINDPSPDSDWDHDYPADADDNMIMYDLMDDSMMSLATRDISDMVSSEHHIHVSDTGLPADMTVTLDFIYNGLGGFSIGTAAPIVAHVALVDITPDPDSQYYIARYLGPVTSPEIFHIVDPVLAQPIDVQPDPNEHGMLEIGILTAVPEPNAALLALLGAGLVSLTPRRRNNSRARSNHRPAPPSACTALVVLTAVAAFAATASAAPTAGTHTHKKHHWTSGSFDTWSSLDSWTSGTKKPANANELVTTVFEGPDLDNLMFNYSLLDPNMVEISQFDQDDVTRFTFTYALSQLGTPPTMDITITEETFEGPGLLEIQRGAPLTIALTLDSIVPAPTPGESLATYKGTVPAGESILIRDPANGSSDFVEYLSEEPYEFEFILTVPEPASAFLVMAAALPLLAIRNPRRHRR